MDIEPKTSLLEGITYTDSLPVDWEVLPALPGDGEQHRYNRANEELLENLLLRDEASQESEESEEGSGQEHFKRIETKLDLLLSLVTEMMTANGSLPQQHTLTLGARGLCVHGHEQDLTPLKEGSLLRVRLFLDAQFPRPLDVYGHLVDVQADCFTVTYCPLGVHLQDLMDKMVFRSHRRAIALSRKNVK